MDNQVGNSVTKTLTLPCQVTKDSGHGHKKGMDQRSYRDVALSGVECGRILWIQDQGYPGQRWVSLYPRSFQLEDHDWPLPRQVAVKEVNSHQYGNTLTDQGTNMKALQLGPSPDKNLANSGICKGPSRFVQAEYKKTPNTNEAQAYYSINDFEGPKRRNENCPREGTESQMNERMKFVTNSHNQEAPNLAIVPNSKSMDIIPSLQRNSLDLHKATDEQQGWKGARHEGMILQTGVIEANNFRTMTPQEALWLMPKVDLHERPKDTSMTMPDVSPGISKPLQDTGLNQAHSSGVRYLTFFDNKNMHTNNQPHKVAQKNFTFEMKENENEAQLIQIQNEKTMANHGMKKLTNQEDMESTYNGTRQSIPTTKTVHTRKHHDGDEMSKILASGNPNSSLDRQFYEFQAQDLRSKLMRQNILDSDKSKWYRTKRRKNFKPVQGKYKNQRHRKYYKEMKKQAKKGHKRRRAVKEVEGSKHQTQIVYTWEPAAPSINMMSIDQDEVALGGHPNGAYMMAGPANNSSHEDGSMEARIQENDTMTGPNFSQENELRMLKAAQNNDTYRPDTATINETFESLLEQQREIGGLQENARMTGPTENLIDKIDSLIRSQETRNKPNGEEDVMNFIISENMKRLKLDGTQKTNNQFNFPEPDQLRMKYLSKQVPSTGRLEDLIYRYEAAFRQRRTLKLLQRANDPCPDGTNETCNEVNQQLTMIEGEMTEILRRMAQTYQNIEKNDKEAYIEMPHFGKNENIDMKAIDALPKFNPNKDDITLSQFWLKMVQYINVTGLTEEKAKLILLYSLQGEAFDAYLINKDQPIKEIMARLQDRFGGFPTPAEFEEQMNTFRRQNNESIKSAMNRYEYIVRQLYKNESDVDKIKERKCKEMLLKIAYPEAREVLERAQQRSSEIDFNYRDRLRIISREEEIIDKRTPVQLNNIYVPMMYPDEPSSESDDTDYTEESDEDEEDERHSRHRSVNALVQEDKEDFSEEDEGPKIEEPEDPYKENFPIQENSEDEEYHDCYHEPDSPQQVINSLALENERLRGELEAHRQQIDHLQNQNNDTVEEDHDESDEEDCIVNQDEFIKEILEENKELRQELENPGYSRTPRDLSRFIRPQSETRNTDTGQASSSMALNAMSLPAAIAENYSLKCQLDYRNLLNPDRKLPK